MTSWWLTPKRGGGFGDLAGKLHPRGLNRMSDHPKPIERSSGTNASERTLARICETTFLGLWSYPNLWRAKNKELCDLLVVFGDDVLIFSDKRCAYPDGDPQISWKRWYKSAVSNSCHQIDRAAKWIQNRPNELYLDVHCSKPFPLDVPVRARLKIHRIVVANGASEACQKHYGEGSGSPMLTPSMRSSGDDAPPLPFNVSGFDKDGNIVHILTESTLSMVLGELDTISDLTAYLNAKEDLILSGKLLAATGEEDLLACFLTNMKNDDEHGFPVANGEVLLVDSHWKRFRSSKEYFAKTAANKISYMWDALINQFVESLTSGTLVAQSGTKPSEMEFAIRGLASETRLRRRALSIGLSDLIHRTRPDKNNVRVFHSRQNPTLLYVFVVTTPRASSDYASYRQARSARMLAYCYAVKHVWPATEEVIALGIDSPGNGGGSEDLIRLNASVWSEEQREEARRIHEDFGLLKKTAEFHVDGDEYPDLDDAGRARLVQRERNRQKRERKQKKQKKRG